MGVYIWKINARFIAGVPDAWYSGETADIWVEYKYLPAKTTPKSIPVALSPLQRHWLTSRRQEGRRVAVIIGVGKIAFILQDNDLDLTRLHTEGRKPYTPREIAEWIRRETQGHPISPS